MRPRDLFAASSLLVASLGAQTAYGDGECVKGLRDTTAAERQTMTQVLETVKAALPATPEGWVIGGYEEISVPSSICMDAESTPWAYNISRIYNRTDDAAQREQALAEAGAAIRAAQAAKQPRMDALMARTEALGAELGAAAQSGDQARVDAVHQQMEQVQREFEALFNEGDNQAQIEAVAAATMQDRSIEIAIAVNPGGISHGDMQSVAAPAGTAGAYRWETTADGVSTGNALVLLGSWQTRAVGGVESGRRGSVSSAAAHAIAFSVTADPSRLDATLAAIDFGAVAALLR